MLTENKNNRAWPFKRPVQGGGAGGGVEKKQDKQREQVVDSMVMNAIEKKKAGTRAGVWAVLNSVVREGPALQA